ncbi:PolyQ domain-containing hypothetical conserved protein [Operophtera brumata]|uniref:PolyQ domain-containing hypothetical conserved protein n=1 Tax=Operophtera brumata TaxID=104452 RepID=A0A0L7LBG1_OPEBR|nr:PolyQ domain-containing hypothetical conserved protein [Operophtera brumata]
MELVSLGKDVLQDIVEHAASYSIGQSVLRQIDRALWVVEKCARWAVPPPLDQDERPQPELIRPLPWMFFMMMLIALRVTRESISLVNLVMGKPPLSKRRYLRTLKYQGNRMMRARCTAAPPADSWYNSLCKLLELTMCFRRKSTPYANNNTTQVSNNDEVMRPVVLALCLPPLPRSCCYSSARGSTGTLGNFAKATYAAIAKTYAYLTPGLWRDIPLTKSPYSEFKA